MNIELAKLDKMFEILEMLPFLTIGPLYKLWLVWIVWREICVQRECERDRAKEQRLNAFVKPLKQTPIPNTWMHYAVLCIRFNANEQFAAFFLFLSSHNVIFGCSTTENMWIEKRLRCCGWSMLMMMIFILTAIHFHCLVRFSSKLKMEIAKVIVIFRSWPMAQCGFFVSIFYVIVLLRRNTAVFSFLACILFPASFSSSSSSCSLSI